MIDFNKILNGDTVTTKTNIGEELEWDVRYVNRSEGFIEVSDEEDTMRVILYPSDIASHIPLK